MAEETTPNTEAEAKPNTEVQEPKAKPAAAAAKAKPPKAPALEDKPFKEFIEQDFNSALKDAIVSQGLKEVELTLVKQPLPIKGAGPEECWQIVGNLRDQKRQFNLYFLDEDINGKKAFSYSNNGTPPSTIESFMIDERKVTLDLLLGFTLKRLNGQKWLARN